MTFEIAVLMFGLGIAGVFVLFEDLIEPLLEERHYKKHGWSISRTGCMRTNPDWLLKQPHVQEQLVALDDLIDRGVIKTQPLQLPIIGGCGR